MTAVLRRKRTLFTDCTFQSALPVMTIIQPVSYVEMASSPRRSRGHPFVLSGGRSQTLTSRQSSGQFAAVAAAALSASSQSLDYAPPPSPQDYPRSPGHQRYPASYGVPSPSSPAMYSPVMSPKHGANLYWTARVSRC